MLRRSKDKTRVKGRPPSGNGASSFHLFWQIEPARYTHAAVTFELEADPQHDRLVFWALQASFTDGTRNYGGAHFGFQWHPDYDDRRAVCWGGYADVGGELGGDPPLLPSPHGNHNVAHFAWTAGKPWRWHIGPTPGRAGWWRASIEHLSTGEVTPVRDLHGGGTHLRDLMVWTEVFAHCDDPSMRMRWSDFAAATESGDTHRPTALSVNYQRYDDGGCTNTDVELGDGYVAQVTNAGRTTPQGTVIDALG